MTIPDCTWKFKHNKKDLFIFFWADASSSYSVFEDASGGCVKNDFDEMSLSLVWGDYTKKTGKKYRFVKAHLHVYISRAYGEIR